MIDMIREFSQSIGLLLLALLVWAHLPEEKK